MKSITFSNVCFFIIAVTVGRLVGQNPILYGHKLHEPPADFAIFREQRVLDWALQQHRNELGADYAPYRNHCLRVLSFAEYYYGAHFTESELDLLGLALAYLDIALWTHGALDYLQPSADLLEHEVKVLLETKEKEDPPPPIPTLTEAELATARAIVTEHHKYSTYASNGQQQIRDDLVNAVRLGDWADATYGVMRGKMTMHHIEAAYEALPDAGFHGVLAAMGARLSPQSFLGRLAVLKIFKW